MRARIYPGEPPGADRPHKDHNHDNNPPDGSNWENLCIYCHENEHTRYVDYQAAGGVDALHDGERERASHNPFEGLKELMNH